MKKTLCFFICLTVSGMLFGSVILDIGTGILVETSGSCSVEVDSLVETGTGYLKGEVTSGAQTGLTEFAGLSLSAGLTGSITRNTGAAYSKGNGEGTNFTRHYEVSNTSGSDVSADMRINFLSSGNDERNGLSGPYFIYRYASSKWNGNGFGVSVTPDTADAVTIPTGSSDWLLSTGSRLAVKAFLEGPYSSSGDTMSTALNDNYDYIPTTSPYTADMRPISTIPSGVVDWVLLQVRSSATADTVSSRSAFIDSDGNIVDDDGTTLYTYISAFPASYYLTVLHRNCLRIMSDETHALSFGSSTQYNFTDNSDKYYGGINGVKELETGVWGMIAGDANGNGEVQVDDNSDYWWQQVGTGGYKSGDFNVNGEVQVDDQADYWWQNVGRGSQVP
ncbi:hypothetical protein ACFL4L_01805 [bacterium]